MLKDITAEGIAALRSKEGSALDEVSIVSLAPGALLRVKDEFNCYLFEITDPEKHRAHVVRCDATPDTPNIGYRGEREVSEVFEIGKSIDHWDHRREAWTGRVTEIHLLAALHVPV